MVELHRLVDIVGNVVASPDDDPVPRDALEVLRDLVGAHAGGYCEAVAATDRRGFECATRPSLTPSTCLISRLIAAVPQTDSREKQSGA